MRTLVLDNILACGKGDELFDADAGKYDDARKIYWEQARKIVGPNYRIPTISGAGDGGMRSELYKNMSHYLRADLMGCCAGLGRCLFREGDTEGALLWLDEVTALHRNIYFTSEKPLYDWMDYNLDYPELTYQRLRAMSLASHIFLSLGNTGAAVHRLWGTNASALNMPPAHHTPRIRTKADGDQMLKLVRGSWLKLSVKATPKVLARYAFASFIWNSHLYVAGGRKESFGPFYRDFWCLDLVKLEGWRRLPDYPIPLEHSGVFLNWNMVVYEDKAYLVTGKPRVDYFDLKTEKWGSILTTYTVTPEDKLAGVVGNWPWPLRLLADSAQQITQDKLLVFGGTHGSTNIGCNLFMELNLKTKVWRRLSDYVMPPPDNDYLCPGPRKSASSWVSKETTRFYLLFGQCDRDGAALRGEPHGADAAFPFEDMWSWDLKKEKWRREMIAGNSPCPRSEVAHTYNARLDKVFTFGGYNPSIPTLIIDRNRQFHFSYFADTFMHSPVDPASPPICKIFTHPSQRDEKAPKWKQVLTRGFPTYRCQAHLNTDPATGKMYLFGGFTNSDYVPCRRDYLSPSFGDVWQLRVDVPGGCFDGVNLEEEARTAKVGPWQRCFTCGDTGPWRKCGGVCGGRAFFCGSECLKEGWKEHKKMHNCQK